MSYFPNDINKLPKDIIRELHITKASDILSAVLIDESLIKEILHWTSAINIDHLLCELPDKGKNIILNEIAKKHGGTYHRLGQIPMAIAELPMPVQHELISNLVDKLEGMGDFYSFDKTTATALANLSPILSTVPIIREFAYGKLHAILRSQKFDLTWKYAASCLNQLVKNSHLYESNTHEKTMYAYLNYLNTNEHVFHVLNAMVQLEDIISFCNENMVKELIKALCGTLTSSVTGGFINLIFQLFGKFSHLMISLPEDITGPMMMTFRDNVALLENSCDLNETKVAFHNINKLRCILEKYPYYAERILLRIFDELTSTKNDKTYRNILLSELFLSWHSLLDPVKKKELMHKLYQHFVNNTFPNWMSPEVFANLMKCFEDCPKESYPLVKFFTSQISNEDNSNISYAIHALGVLNFALKEDANSSISIVTWIKDTLSQQAQKIDTRHDHLNIALISAIDNMSTLIAMHPEYIKPIMMDLCTMSENMHYYLNDVMKTLIQLGKHIDHALFTHEDIQRISKTALHVDSTAASADSADLLCLFNNNHKKIFIEKEILPTMHFYFISSILIRIAFNQQKNHAHFLSWICVLNSYIKKSQPQQERINLANASVMLFSHLKRQELLAEKFPKELASCVEDYADSETAAFMNKKC
jgi:hypothetical protein